MTLDGEKSMQKTQNTLDGVKSLVLVITQANVNIIRLKSDPHLRRNLLQ